MRGAGQVVVDGVDQDIIGEWVAEVPQHSQQLLRTQQVDQHQYVGLLGEPVTVRGVALGFENEVQPADVAVGGAVAVPVQLDQVLVAVELTDHPVVDWHGQPAAQVRPARRLLWVHAEPGDQLVALVSGQQGQGLGGPPAHPGSQDVGVGVVLHALPRSLGIAVVVLIGAHHPGDVEAVRRRVVGSQGRKQPRDLDDQLGAAFGEPGQVAGGLVVLPGVVGDGQADVQLPAGVVRHPSTGSQVEQLGRGLFPAVAAALPREHCSRQAGGAGGLAGGVQAAPAIVQQRPGHRWQVRRHDGQHEQLVPEHVPPVALPVQSAGGYPDVHGCGMGGNGLKQVEHVQVQHQLARPVCGVQADPEPVPQPGPGGPMTGQQAGEPARGTGELVEHTQLGRCHRWVTRGGDGDGLVDQHWAPVLQREVEPVGVRTVLRGLDHRCRGELGTAGAGPGRCRDPDPALGGLGRHHQGVRPHLLDGDGAQVPVCPTPILGDVVVGDPGVDPGPHADRPVPAIGNQRRLQRGQVRALH